MANVFKTPGKVRGKTPRTARKRNVPGADARIVSLLPAFLAFTSDIQITASK